MELRGSRTSVHIASTRFIPRIWNSQTNLAIARYASHRCHFWHPICRIATAGGPSTLARRKYVVLPRIDVNTCMNTTKNATSNYKKPRVDSMW